jgi:isoleucyl-tRNA synthetase
LEEARADKLIGKSLEASVALDVDDDIMDVIEDVLKKPAQWFVVSEVTYEDKLPKYDTIGVKVKKAAGAPCPRCWNYTTAHNEDGLCDRCAKIILHK